MRLAALLGLCATLQAPQPKPTFCIDYRPALVARISHAVATEEGWGRPGSIATRYNNPGCIKFAGQRGASRGDKGYAKFSTPERGWYELTHWFETRAQLPLGKALWIYNPDKAYRDKIIRRTHTSASTVIAAGVVCQ